MKFGAVVRPTQKKNKFQGKLQTSPNRWPRRIGFSLKMGEYGTHILWVIRVIKDELFSNGISQLSVPFLLPLPLLSHCITPLL